MLAGRRRHGIEFAQFMLQLAAGVGDDIRQTAPDALGGLGAVAGAAGVVIRGVFTVAVVNLLQDVGFVVTAVFAISPLQALLLAGRRRHGMEFQFVLQLAAGVGDADGIRLLAPDALPALGAVTGAGGVVIGGVFTVAVANRTQRSGYIVIAVFAIRPLQARLLAGRRCLGMEFAHAVACGRKCLSAHYYRLQRS